MCLAVAFLHGVLMFQFIVFYTEMFCSWNSQTSQKFQLSELRGQSSKITIPQWKTRLEMCIDNLVKFPPLLQKKSFDQS